MPVFLAIIHELALCSIGSTSKSHLWRLAERSMFYGAERHQLLSFLSHEAERAPEVHREAVERALRSFEEWNERDRLPFAVAFAETFEALPKGMGEEFHFLRLLQRIEPRFEGRLNIADLILGRVPAMRPADRELAFAVMKRLESGDFDG